jgi:micrococcal nuclease
MRRVLSLLFALLLSLSAGLSVLADHDPPDGIPGSAEAATVRAIVDDDTVRVTREDGTKNTVRLIGIDTPETKDPNSPVECFGPEASDRIAKLLPVGRAIWLETDQSS